MDQWGFFYPLFNDNDPIPEVYVAPPLTSLSEAEFLEKLPLVCKITAAYEKTPASKPKKRFFWRRKRCQHKQATHWVYGLLFTMSRKSLEMLKDDPSQARSVCDGAEDFVKLCEFLLLTLSPLCVTDFGPISESSVMKQQFKEPDVFWMPKCTTGMLRRIRERDAHMCVVTSRAPSVGSIYLARFHVATEPALEYLKSLFPIVDVLLGAASADRAWNLLCNKKAADTWNIVTLNLCLVTYFDLGYLAFRPLAIAIVDSTSDEVMVQHAVYFSAHWRPKTSTDPGGGGAPRNCNEDTVRSMLAEDGRYAERKKRIGDFHCQTGRRILDGDEFCVVHDRYDPAESMYVMLALRWQADMALCLAGGVGLGEPGSTPCESESE